MSTRTESHIRTQKVIQPLAEEKMKGCTGRREAKGRQSERGTGRERYKLRGKTQGMWGLRGVKVGGEQNDILRRGEAKVSCDLE